jgi:N utilization substance protein B
VRSLAGQKTGLKTVGARTKGREAALQMLFALDASGGVPDTTITTFWREFPGDAEGRPYADGLVEAVTRERTALDERIATASERWRVERMPRVDRNVLRIATWELLREPETPRAVILDEAVDLAKRYGTADSGAFVNGVLSRIADDCGRRAESEGVRGAG